MYNPKRKLVDLKIPIGEQLFKAQKEVECKLFKEAWNSVTKADEATIQDECVLNEWRWCIPTLVIACQQTIHSVVKWQFDCDKDEVVRYIADSEDCMKAYYLAGVVWRPLLKANESNKATTIAIRSLFIEKSQTSAEGLPTNEVDLKYVT